MTLLNEFGRPMKTPKPQPQSDAGLYKFSEAEMPPVYPGEGLLRQDYYRGIRIVCRFLDDGRMNVQERQAIPDDFIKREIRYQREVWEAGKGRPNTQKHWQPIGSIPDGLKRQVLETDPGHFLDMRDPEYEKRLTKFWNDLDYRDLRISEGRV